MKTHVINLQLLAALLLSAILTTSCYRQPLEDEGFENQKIPVSIDWSKADIDPQNATLLFYSEADGKLVLEHTFENSHSRIQSYADVPLGTYTVVVFNELRNQINYVGVRGHENLATLEFYAKPDTEVKARATTGTYVQQPDIVATAVLRGIKIEKGTQALTGIVPERKVGYMDINVHIAGLNNARMPALVDLKNIAGSYFPDTDRNSTDPVACQFMMENRQYDPGSSTDGTISTQIRVFGVLGNRGSVEEQPAEQPITLDILLMLVDADKTIVNHVMNITDLISFTDAINGSISLDTELEVPDPLPEVIPEGGESGFGSDLTEWEGIDIPLTQY